MEETKKIAFGSEKKTPFKQAVQTGGLREIISLSMPSAEQFFTNWDGCIAFKSGYPMPILSGYKELSQTIGIAVDYLERILLAKQLTPNFFNFENTSAKRDYLIYIRESKSQYREREDSFYSRVIDTMGRTLTNAQDHINEYLTERAPNDFGCIINSIIDLAHFEGLEHTKLESEVTKFPVDAEFHLKKAPYEIGCELRNLGQVFLNRAIANIIYIKVPYDHTIGVTPSRVNYVLLSPNWIGMCHRNDIGGARADFYANGVLYESKAVSWTGWDTGNMLQLWGYFLLDCLAKTGHYVGKNEVWDDSTKIPYNWPIRAVAFYKARHGVIEYFSLEKANREQVFESLLRLSKYLELRVTEKDIKRWFSLQEYIGTKM